MSLRRLAWVLFALYVGLQAATLWVIWDGPDGAGDAIGAVVLGYAFVGALVASRHPRRPVGWLLLAIALVFSIDMFGESYAYYSPDAPGYLAVVTISSLAFSVWVFLAAIVLPLVFPDGQLLSGRWRRVAWIGAAVFVVSLVGAALVPRRLDLPAGVEDRVVLNPLGVSGTAADIATVLGQTAEALLGVGLVVAVVSLVLRFRRSHGTERQQLKWVVYVCLMAMTGLALAVLGGVLPVWGDLVGGIGWFTFMLSLLIGIPVAIGIAILRHRLFDIDVVINRTLVYGSLTATLALSYLGLVLLLRLVLDPLAGQSDLAVAASTLAVAALVRPLRSRIQTVVDRRFYRSRYDASRTLEGFAGRLRDELDLDTLGVDLRRVVDETMQPAHVSLWLREARP
jgi:hypothetical protein